MVTLNFAFLQPRANLGANRMLSDRGQSIIKTHKKTGALSFFKSRERNKDDSITFDWK